MRAITRGPKFHRFGYCDKRQFDPTGRFALGMAVDFEHRNPGPEDAIRGGMVDLRDGDRWIGFGQVAPMIAGYDSMEVQSISLSERTQ